MKVFLTGLLFLFTTSTVLAETRLRYDDLPDAPAGLASYEVHGNSWSYNDLTYFFSNGTGDIAGTQEEQAFRDAFALWAGVTPLTFTEVNNAADADIIIMFATGDHGDGSDFDGTNGVLAHAFYPPPNGSFAGDMHFDDAEAWTLLEQNSGGQPIDLVTVAAHEIGHAIGLKHSDVSGALMYPYYSGSQRYLHQDDIDGIQSVYGALVIEDTAEPSDYFGYAVASGDFDGDGEDDLAVGVPREDINDENYAGAVNVIYGSDNGLDNEYNQFWHQDSPGIHGLAEEGDQFGFSLATGDFNGDGFDDLAVGVVYEDVNGEVNAGAVNVIFGSVFGLVSTGNELWHQDIATIQDTADDYDYFGRSLASGDFDNDGYDDLAIGVYGEDVSGISGAGAAHVLYGSSGGLSDSGDQFWHQVNGAVVGTANASEGFGYSLAAGDFDGDDHDDLAIGVWGDDVGDENMAGGVNVIYGTPSGLLANDDQLWHQDVAGVVGIAEDYDRFGNALATGDFDNDGRDDLAVGVYAEDLNDTTNAGAVNIFYGSAAGLTATGDQLWAQSSTNIEGVTEPNDFFGWSLTTGDYDNDGYDDIGIGVYGESVEDSGVDDEDAGAVNVIYGTLNGLNAAGDQIWTQDAAGITWTNAEPGDFFGFALTSGDYDGDGYSDIGIGAHLEDVGAITNAGSVNVLYGGAGTGLNANNDDWWHQNR